MIDGLNLAGAQERRMLYATATAQFAVAVAGALVAGWLAAPIDALSALWGGLAALTNTVLLAWRMLHGDRPALDARRQLRLMYRSTLERFFVVVMLLVLGVLLLGLEPLPVLLGLLAGQMTLAVFLISSGIKVK